MPVYITFGTLPAGYCPTSAQDFVSQLYYITSARTADNQQVKITFGVFLPGFCDPTPAMFITELNKIVAGFVVATDDPVHVEFGSGAASFCWNQPQTVVAALAGNYTAYVEGT